MNYIDKHTWQIIAVVFLAIFLFHAVNDRHQSILCQHDDSFCSQPWTDGF